MEVTHVIRSQEFTSSVPKFLNLYDALAIEWPKFATLPYVLGLDGKKKLSKRDGAKDILDYRKEGYLPGALVSFLATLGWNDGTTQEIYSREELIKKFSFGRVQKSGAKFDEQRLKWINGKMIRSLDYDNKDDRELFFSMINPYLPPSAFTYRQEVIRYIFNEIKEKSHLLSESEIKEQASSFFNEDYELHADLLQSSAAHFNNPKQVLQTIKSVLKESDFTPDDIQKKLRELVVKLDTTPLDLFGLIRVAITGKEVAPGLWNLIAFVGRDKVLARLDRAIALLDS
jgi:glutamyl/glutaminyl-tRNA synthetase